MNKLKLTISALIFSAGLIGIGSNVMAESIYCAPTIVCSNNNIKNCRLPLGWIIDRGEIAYGLTVTFTHAMALYKNVGECAYRSVADPTMWLVSRYIEPLSISDRLENNKWVEGFCDSNNNVIYCPFKRGDE